MLSPSPSASALLSQRPLNFFYTSHSTVRSSPCHSHTGSIWPPPYGADRSRQALCCDISAEWIGCTVQRDEGEGAKGEKTLFYPVLHFNNPFPADVEGVQDWMHEYVWRGGGVWNIKWWSKLGEQENCGYRSTPGDECEMGKKKNEDGGMITNLRIWEAQAKKKVRMSHRKGKKKEGGESKRAGMEEMAAAEVMKGRGKNHRKERLRKGR